MKALTCRIALVFGILAATLSATAQVAVAVPGVNILLPNVYVSHMDRTVLGEDVAHYRFDVVVGTGIHDRIRLHRIVREKQPWRPIHTVAGVVLFPGGPNSFQMIFMEPQISQVLPWDQSITAFFAKHNIDVWGMDYRWALVPADTADFKFMKTWSLQRDVDDAKIAVSLARLIRASTGQGFGQIPVLGFSYGTFMTYSMANQETQLPKILRNVNGMILADWGVTFASGSPLRQDFCGLIPGLQEMYDAGTYNEDNSALALFADLARHAPDEPSQFADGFTNLQFVMFIGASVVYAPSWHFVAGVFDENGITTNLQYTDPQVWIDVLGAIPTWFPVKADLDSDKVVCNGVVPPFDDHLKQIKLPILYVGAAGGAGKEGYVAVGRTGSTDVTKFTIQLHPDDQAALDFGHADMFTATNAETLVWQPMLDWLVAHH
jgi:hypothetical protein